MKKILLSSAFAIFSIAAGFGQGAPNGSFENWTGTTYDVLTNYSIQSSNIQSLQDIGQVTMTKVADPFHASFAIRLDTKTNGIDTTFGFYINGNPGGGATVPGGIPYALIPTGLHGHYKSGVVVGDSALVLVIFKKSGAVIGQFVQYITGNHAAYTTFNLPISGLPFAPDTVVVGATSSNPFSMRPNFKGLPGSFLQLDSLSFTGVASQPALMNGDFENWSTATYYTPDYWAIEGDSVQRSTVAHNGIYSLELQVTPQNGGGGGSGANADQATTGHFTAHSGPAGGTPYSVQNDSLTGYYKMVSVGTDTAFISVNTSKLGTSVGGNVMQLLGNTSYQRFGIAVNSSVVPDTMRIEIQAANYPVRAACIGTKLYIDQLSMQSSPLSVPLVIMGNDKVEVYPNPSKGLFNLIYDSNSDETVSLEIYNSLGQKMFSKQLNGQAEMRTQLDFSSYGKGIYFMKTIQGNHISSTKMIVE